MHHNRGKCRGTLSSRVFAGKLVRRRTYGGEWSSRNRAGGGTSSRESCSPCTRSHCWKPRERVDDLPTLISVGFAPRVAPIPTSTHALAFPHPPPPPPPPSSSSSPSSPPPGPLDPPQVTAAARPACGPGVNRCDYGCYHSRASHDGVTEPIPRSIENEVAPVVVHESVVDCPD